MYYELFSCSDVTHLPYLQSFYVSNNAVWPSSSIPPCAHAWVFLGSRHQEVELLGHRMWVRHFAVSCPVVLQSRCTNLHTWVWKYLFVHILLTHCIADFSFSSICLLWSVTYSQWPTETLVGMMDSWHLWA